MKAFPLIRILDRGAMLFLVLLGAFAIAIPVMNLLVPAGSALHVSTYLVALFGKYLCYALLALSIDLIWGYAGILSLGHGAFFALGGYAMGMYLMRQIGTRGVYGDPVLPDFMVFLNWKALPVYWYGFQHFAYAALMILLVPGLLAFVFGWFAFRSRVTGVYLSIITQAMTYALLLGFFRNDFGFGGNNGLTDFKDILGFNVQTETTRNALLVITCIALALAFLICRALVTSKFGKVLVAIRDAEARTRFLGYRVEAYKLFVFTLSACMAGVAGALYVPQVGIINPSEFAPGNSIEAVIWVAVGGRGTLTGAVLGALRGQLRQDLFHLRRARALLAVHAGRAVHRRHLAAAARHRRHVEMGFRPARRRSLERCRAGRRRQSGCRGGPAERRAARGGAGPMTDSMTESKTATQTDTTIGKQTTSALLYLDGITVSFDGFKALNELSFAIEPGEMRAIIGPNGAGKTTMMDVVTGKTRPGLGRCVLRGGQIRPVQARRNRNRRARHRPQVSEADRVRHAHGGGQSAAGAEKRPPRALDAALAILGTAKKSASRKCSTPCASRRLRSRVAGSLSHGQKQWLEIAMLLAQEPKLLLVDEPVAGMTDVETMQTAELLKEINATKTVVVVEHDMAFVRELGVKVTCLHEGSVLAEGTIDQVSQNERVVEVYLGR